MPIYPDRESWLDARRAGIGASDAPIILGLSPWKSALRLFGEKLGLIAEDKTEREAVEWGARLEPAIADKYHEETGRRTESRGPYCIDVSADRPWMLATLDRDVYRPGATGSEEIGALEIKTAAIWKRDEWVDEPPLIYQVQVQHQLMVTGRTWGSLAVLIGGQRFVWTDVKRNDNFIDRLADVEAGFWRRIQTHDPPPTTAGALDAEALAALYPTEQQMEPIVLGGDALAWDAELLDAKENIERLEEVKTRCENKIKEAMGVHGVAVLPNGVRYTWRKQTRAGYSVPPNEFRAFRRLTSRR